MFKFSINVKLGNCTSPVVQYEQSCCFANHLKILLFWRSHCRRQIGIFYTRNMSSTHIKHPVLTPEYLLTYVSVGFSPRSNLFTSAINGPKTCSHCTKVWGMCDLIFSTKRTKESEVIARNAVHLNCDWIPVTWKVVKPAFYTTFTSNWTTWPSFPFTCRLLFLHINCSSSFTQFLIHKNFFSCFYLLIFYFENFSTWIWHLPYTWRLNFLSLIWNI